MKDPTIIQAHDHYVSHVLFHPDSQTLLSAGLDSLIKLWSVPSWQLIWTLEGHAKDVEA